MGSPVKGSTIMSGSARRRRPSRLGDLPLAGIFTAKAMFRRSKQAAFSQLPATEAACVLIRLISFSDSDLNIGSGISDLKTWRTLTMTLETRGALGVITRVQDLPVSISSASDWMT